MGDSTQRTASVILRGIVLLQCGGLLWKAFTAGSAIEACLFSEVRMADTWTFAIDQTAAVLVMGLAIGGFFTRWSLGYFVIAAWFIGIAAARQVVGGVPFDDLVILGHATRIAAPLVVAVMRMRRAPEGPQLYDELLRGALAVTFVVHGWEAFNLHPAFIDYILVADRRIFGLGLDQAAAEGLLEVIGVVDVVVAAAVLLRRMNLRKR